MRETGLLDEGNNKENCVTDLVYTAEVKRRLRPASRGKEEVTKG